MADSGGLYIINGTNNSLVTNIPLSYGGTGVGVNPNTNLIYVASHDNNSTYIVNGTDNSILDKIITGNNPVGVAVNPNTNRIYVTNSDDNTVSVIDDNIASPDFLVTSSPSYFTIPDGSSGNTKITASSFDGFSGNVSFSASPPSLTTSFNPPSVMIPSGGSVSSLLTVSVPSSVSSGEYTVTVTGTNGSLTRSTYVSVLVYTVPPSAPQSLSATTVSASQINLIWSAPSDNGSSAITGYKIERSTDTGSIWNTIVSNTGSTATTYFDAKLIHSATYTYRVSAINSVGTSSPSNTASATTLNAVPTPPTGLSATVVSTSQINLGWNSPSDNGGTPVTSYMLERSTNDGSTWNTIVSNTDSTGTTYSDTGLSPNTTYTYRVSAINSVGTSNPSSTASATTPILNVGGVNVGPTSKPALP
jgi:YVTN family beta-propeller protein